MARQSYLSRLFARLNPSQAVQNRGAAARAAVEAAATEDEGSQGVLMVTLKRGRDAQSWGDVAGDVSRDGAFVRHSPDGVLVRAMLDALLPQRAQLLEAMVMPGRAYAIIYIHPHTDRDHGQRVDLHAAIRTAVDRVNSGEGRMVISPAYTVQKLSGAETPHCVRYIRQAPWRQAYGVAHPDIFRTVTDISICGHSYRALGNILLLCNPFKVAVVFHRSDSASVRRDRKSLYTTTGSRGGVLVSPFISAAERDILSHALSHGIPVIYITSAALPAGATIPASFLPTALQGKSDPRRLLVISVAPDHKPLPITRPLCLRMNALAATIASRYW